MKKVLALIVAHADFRFTWQATLLDVGDDAVFRRPRRIRVVHNYSPVHESLLRKGVMVTDASLPQKFNSPPLTGNMTGGERRAHPRKFYCTQAGLVLSGSPGLLGGSGRCRMIIRLRRAILPLMASV